MDQPKKSRFRCEKCGQAGEVRVTLGQGDATVHTLICASGHVWKARGQSGVELGRALARAARVADAERRVIDAAEAYIGSPCEDLGGRICRSRHTRLVQAVRALQDVRARRGTKAEA